MEGNLINRLLENGGNLDTPVVGMGGTTYHYSDRSAFTVTRIIDAKTIVARGDTPVYAPNSGMGSYPTSYTEATGGEFTLVLTKTGWRTATYTPTGRLRTAKGAGTPARLGGRDAYYDPHF